MNGDLDPKVPQDLEAERLVLSGLLLGGAQSLAPVLEILRREHFYREPHALVFDAMTELFRRDEPIDALTVANQLEKMGRIDGAGGRLFIGELVSIAGPVSNAQAYARIIREKALLRGLVSAGREISEKAQAGLGDVAEILDEAEASVFKIAEESFVGTTRDAKSTMHDALDHLERIARRGGRILGCSTGLSDLDRFTSGLLNGEMHIVAGRPGMGKTALMLGIALHASLVEQRPTLVFSLEMSWLQVAIRLMAMHGRMNSHRVRTANLTREEWPKLSIKAGELSQAKLWIDDSPNPSPLEIRAKCRRLRAREGLGLVVVDYLQLMQLPGGAENRQQEISVISRELKALAKELEVPVVVGSQLSRKVEDRAEGSKRPQLADLRESGAIEQDADLVLFVYRPIVYGRREVKVFDGTAEKPISTENYAEFIIGKNRNGPVGSIHVGFIPEYTLFTDLDLSRVEETSVSRTSYEGTPF